MRTLLIIRHAKSSWDDPGMDDFDRPLNDRGKRDAPAMAEVLKGRNIMPDRFFSSPAKRAKKTAEIFAKAYAEKEISIELIPELYHAPSEIFYEVIGHADNSVHTLAVFAHNPGITDFANSLTEQIRIDNIPTSGIFAVSLQSDAWQDIRKAEKNFLFFDYPKKFK